MFGVKLIKATEQQHYQDFIDESLCSIHSEDYLKNNDVYILYKKGEAIGGFVYGMGGKLKSIEAVKSAEVRQRCYEQFQDIKVAEITTFWLKKEYRKTWISRALWFSIAIKTYWGKADYYIFATTKTSLRRSMDYPSCCFEFLTAESIDAYRDKFCYGFIVERRKTIWGMLQGIFGFISKPSQPRKKSHQLDRFRIHNS